MKKTMVLFRFGALPLALLFFLGGSGGLSAQTPTEPSSTPQDPELLSQAELLKAFMQVKEQLYTTQLAMSSADAKARAQTAGIAQQLEAIRTSIAAERERQQSETLRLQADRERQQLENQKAEAERDRLQIASDRASQRMLYVASTFGCAGLLAMILVPVFQWRAINRIAEVDAQRTRSDGLVSVDGLLPEEMGGQAATLANQRLMTAIDRIEQRIFELENTATPTLPAEISRGKARNGAEVHRLPGVGGEKANRIAVLLAKGRSLLSTNKAAEALACYEEILALDAHHTDALLRKGVALERLARDAEAIASYDQAIAIDAKMALAYLHKGGVCQRLARHDEAVACYEQALQVEEAAK